MGGLQDFWSNSDLIGRTVALTLLGLSIGTWVIILWKGWVLRRALGDIGRDELPVDTGGDRAGFNGGRLHDRLIQRSFARSTPGANRLQRRDCPGNAQPSMTPLASLSCR